MKALDLSFEALGAAALALFDEAGGMALLAWRVLVGLLTLKLDRRELLRSLYKMGVQSLPIVALTAFFTGGIMVIQSGIFVRRFGAYGLLGFGAGYATLREVGPILIGLMFSGRVGANNAAELGTMTVTEQLDGLRALAIEPIGFLIVPRVVAMMISLFCLVDRRRRRRHLRRRALRQAPAQRRAVLVLPLVRRQLEAVGPVDWPGQGGRCSAWPSRSPAATSAPASRAAPSASAARSTTPWSPPPSPS